MWGKRIALVAVLAILATAGAKVTLKRKGITMLPASYATVDTMETPTFKYDEGAGEQLTLDTTLQIAYVVGETGLMHIVDFSDSSNLQTVKAVELPQAATDVEMCGDYIAVAVEGETKTANGQVIIYEKYTADSTGMAEVQTLETGPLPDMIKFKKDCSVLLAANEGEAEWVDGAFVNPPGSVSMFEFAGGDLTATPTTTTLTFEAIAGALDDPEDAKAVALFEAGVGWQLGPHALNLPADYPAASQSLARNLEPEYIAFSSDETKAYICLQEASAIATVDLATKAITSVDALGDKDWKALGLAFDASDRDDGINRQIWPVVGRYMPDTIASFKVGDVEYIATANEGDVVEYGVDTDAEFACDVRGDDLVTMLDDSIDSFELQVALCDETQLGRLKFECSCGRTDEGKFEKLCALSTRSWSIFKADTMELVWDSGSDVEKVLAEHHPEIFNSNDPSPGDSQSDELDSRSDDKGAEVESLAVGVIDGKTLIFVGLERTSTVMVYDASDPTAPVFHTSLRLSGSDDVPESLDEGTATPQASVGVFDPEAMYVDETNKLLIVAGSVSGTVAVYSISLPESVVDIPTENGVKVLEAGDAKCTFAPTAFPTGTRLKVFEEPVDNSVSPAPGTRAASTKAVRFWASMAPTAAIKFILKIIGGNRRADTDMPIVHWLNERTNEWQPVCGTTAESTGEVSAELSPEILNSPDFDRATGCDTSLPCVSGDGGSIAAFYIDESVCNPPPTQADINLPDSTFTPSPDSDDGPNHARTAQAIIGTLIGVIGFGFVICIVLSFNHKPEPAKAATRDVELAAPTKTADVPAVVNPPPQQPVVPAPGVPAYSSAYQGPYPPPMGMGMGMPSTALPPMLNPPLSPLGLPGGMPGYAGMA